jgi:hypothetical protein
VTRLLLQCAAMAKPITRRDHKSSSLTADAAKEPCRAVNRQEGSSRRRNALSCRGIVD